MGKINKSSYGFHNGYINKVTMTGIIDERMDTSKHTKVKISNGCTCIEFTVNFKLSWLKYKVGTYVNIIARALIDDNLTFEIKYISPANLLDVTNDNELCKIALSGFVGVVTQNNNVEVQLMQDCKTAGYNIVVVGSYLSTFYFGQALHLEGIVRNNKIISKLATIFPASIGKNKHISKLPQWLSEYVESKAGNNVIEKYKDWL
jgi:hypothetical protein